MVDATAPDVRLEIETYLDDEEIEGDPNDPDDDGIIGRVSREIDRAMSDPPSAGTAERQDLEATLAALWIATRLDRAESKASSGRTSATYEESVVETLRASARRLDAPEDLITSKQSFDLAVPDTSGSD